MKKFFAVVLLFPLVAFAHGEGASYEAVVEGHIIDIGYSEPSPVAGDVVNFDFNLYPEGAGPGAETPFTDVWVRIESQSGLLLASGIHNAEFGGTRLTLMFPFAGTYTVSARYEHNGEPVVATEFEFGVGPASDDAGIFSSAYTMPFGVGLIVGLVLFLLWSLFRERLSR